MRALQHCAGALAGLLILTWPGTAPAQETGVVSSEVGVSSGRAELAIERADGERLEIAFAGGELRLDGEVVGAYRIGGELERSWRQVLGRAALLEADELGRELAAWEPEAASADRPAAAALRARLSAFLAAPAPAALPETATVAAPDGSQVTIAPGLLSFQDLSESLRRLESSLARLGRGAEGAGENLALIVHADYAVEAGRTVPGNLALVGGDLDLEGTVEGDALVLGGTLRLLPTARVEGDVLRVGGEVAELGGRVEGEIVSVTVLGPEAAPAPAAPEPPHVDAPRPDREGPGFFGRIGRNFSRATGDVIGTLAFFVVLGAAGILTVYLARPRLEVVADTVRGNFVRSFGVGIAGQLLFFPVLLVLVVAIVTILLIPFYVVGVGLGLLLGYLGVAHAVGETVALQRYRWFERLRLRRSNSYYYTLSGLAFLLAPFALAGALQIFGGLLGFIRGLTIFAAVVTTWAALTSGLGAVILTRGGSRDEYARPATPAGGDLYGTGDLAEGGSRRA